MLKFFLFIGHISAIKILPTTLGPSNVHPVDFAYTQTISGITTAVEEFPTLKNVQEVLPSNSDMESGIETVDKGFDGF